MIIFCIHRFYEGLKRDNLTIEIIAMAQYSSFLWGIETIYHLPLLLLLLLVFIVSMRDWNIMIKGVVIAGTFGIHRFYEGLKLNEKGLVKYQFDEYSSFLWGIETIKIYHFISPHLLVFIVSMRDWNSSVPKNTEETYTVFIVSMRDWNRKIYPLISWRKLSIHRFYEGLKLILWPEKHAKD